MGNPCTIALVAHDGKKDDLLDWVTVYREQLARHSLLATGTTGKLLKDHTGLPVQAMLSGPLGGDLQLGAKIAEGEVDILIFFWDPLASQPHDPDVKAILRVAAVWDIAVATNRATADFLMSSPLLNDGYRRRPPDFSGHLERFEKP